MGTEEQYGILLDLSPKVGCAGVIVATGGEPHLNLLGLVAALSATCGRAFKSVLQVAFIIVDSHMKSLS